LRALQHTARLRDEVICVDDFPQDFGRAELALLAAHKAAAGDGKEPGTQDA
jgi:hypothetical protein